MIEDGNDISSLWAKYDTRPVDSSQGLETVGRNYSYYGRRSRSARILHSRIVRRILGSNPPKPKRKKTDLGQHKRDELFTADSIWTKNALRVAANLEPLPSEEIVVAKKPITYTESLVVSGASEQVRERNPRFARFLLPLGALVLTGCAILVSVGRDSGGNSYPASAVRPSAVTTTVTSMALPNHDLGVPQVAADSVTPPLSQQSSQQLSEPEVIAIPSPLDVPRLSLSPNETVWGKASVRLETQKTLHPDDLISATADIVNYMRANTPYDLDNLPTGEQRFGIPDELVNTVLQQY